MVGNPKNLSDLYRIEAQVQVTCKSCRAQEVWELDALIAEVCRATIRVRKRDDQDENPVCRDRWRA